MILRVEYIGGPFGSPNDYGLVDENDQIQFLLWGWKDGRSAVNNRKLLPTLIVTGRAIPLPDEQYYDPQMNNYPY